MVSRDGRSVYVANQSTSQIFQYDVRVDGTLLPKSPDTVAAGQEPFGVAVSPDGKSVYVANVHSDNVSQYDVGPGGGLSPKSPATVPAGSFPIWVTVAPDGQSVYVTNEFSEVTDRGSVSQYDVGADGRLSPKSPATVLAGESRAGSS